MKTILLSLLLFPVALSAQYRDSVRVQPKSWRFNSGLDVGAWWGGTGVTPLAPASNELIASKLHYQIAYTGDIYFEWLHKKAAVGRVGPDFGIKTKLVWDWFTANNGGSGNGYESLTLNYVDVPLLFEYCLSFKNKVTVPHYIAPNTNYQTYVYDHGYYYHVITTETSTPGGWTAGGVPYSNAIFIYAGPQICYLTEGFHNVNGKSTMDTDPALEKSYAGFVGGFCFYLANINVDISYQRALTSIAKGQNVYVSGFLFRLGFNLTRRKF